MKNRNDLLCRAEHPGSRSTPDGKTRLLTGFRSSWRLKDE